MNCNKCGKWAGAYAGFAKDHDLCTCQQPKKEWQGLTDEEVRWIHKGETFYDFARAIETKLKEKNNANDA